MYFEHTGKENTNTCVELAVKRAKELGIEYVVVASTTGYTIEKIIEKNPSVKVVCVTHSVGFRKDVKDEFEQDRKALEKKGVKVLTTTHLMAGLNRRRSWCGSAFSVTRCVNYPISRSVIFGFSSPAMPVPPTTCGRSTLTPLLPVWLTRLMA